MDVEELVVFITERLNKNNISTKLKRSNLSPSIYIKVNNYYTIRVSDHYKRNDGYNKYNIGAHIHKFKKIKGAYYYRPDRCNNLIKKIVKDIKDNKINE